MLQEPSPHQLEDALTRRRGGHPIAASAGIHPAAERLEELLKLGDAIDALPAGAADAEARGRIRQQVIADVAGHRTAWVHQHRLPVKRGRHPLPSHGFRWTLVLALAVLLALIAGVTLAMAAQLSEPDSSLYGLKLKTEAVLLAVNRSDVSKAGVHLQLASQRYRDAEAMAAVGKGDLAVSSMAAYYDELRQAGSELAAAPRTGSWKSVRDQFDSAESKPIDTILTQLQNSHQAAAATQIQKLADRFGNDRKSIDVKLNGPSAKPNPTPSGASSAPIPIPSPSA